MNRWKKFIGILITLFIATPVLADPIITNVTGGVNDGATITVTGSNFGTKATAAPLKWDKFESGTNGAVIGNGWDYVTGCNQSPNPNICFPPIYSTGITRTNSTKSIRCNFDDFGRTDCVDGEGCNWTSSFGISGVASPGFPVIYVDAWVHYVPANPESRNVKLMRIHTNTYQPNEYFNIYCLDDTDGARLSGDPTLSGFMILPSTPWRGTSFFRNSWRHIQLYIKQSSPGVPDGDAVLAIDNYKSVNKINAWQTRTSSGQYFDTFWMGNFVAHKKLCNPGLCDCDQDSPGGTYIYWDDAYIDITRAHIEIGNAPTYAACTHTEIQIPISWSTTGLSFTANIGSFSSLAGTYVYVTDSNGLVNSNGYALQSASIDVAQSYFVPQATVNSVTVEGAAAIKYAVTCPNNDLLTNDSRIKIVLKTASGTPMANVPAQNIYAWLNGGPASQGFSGGGDDTLMASSVWQPLAGCPNTRFIVADRPTDATGTTYISWKGVGGSANRDPNRKWGLFAGDIPIMANGTQLQGRLTSTSANGTYTANVKNVDVFDQELTNRGELVDNLDLNVVQAAIGGAYQYRLDFNNDGVVDLLDYAIVRAHQRHKCNYPNAN